MITMEQKIKAVEKSIQKWENIVAGHGADFGPLNCECCKTHNRDCTHCLVHAYSGGCCSNTPYNDWLYHHQVAHSELFPLRHAERIVKCYNPLCPKCKEIAQREVDFLERVLEYAKAKTNN